MDARVTSFPFNVNDDPMYNGTALMSLGTALWYRTWITVMPQYRARIKNAKQKHSFTALPSCLLVGHRLQQESTCLDLSIWSTVSHWPLKGKTPINHEFTSLVQKRKRCDPAGLIYLNRCFDE
jgi:hypothetical protein